MRRVIAALLTIFLLELFSFAQGPNQDVVSRARHAYYNLPKHGFRGFKAGIKPNWHVILGPAATSENLKVFRALRFSMSVDADGHATVTHDIVNPEKIRIEPYVQQIHDNVNRLVTSFFNTWATFVVSSPFPANDSEVKIQILENEYRVLYRAQSVDTSLTLTDDLLITQLTLANAGGKRTVKPVFDRTAQGLLLSSYHSNFEAAGEGVRTILDLQIEYQEFNGMRLPHKIQIKGIYGSEPVEAELEFSQYEVDPRQATLFDTSSLFEFRIIGPRSAGDERDLIVNKHDGLQPE